MQTAILTRKLKYKKCPSSLCCSNVSKCKEALLLPYVQLLLSANDTTRRKTATFANSFNTINLSATQPLRNYMEIKEVMETASNSTTYVTFHLSDI